MTTDEFENLDPVWKELDLIAILRDMHLKIKDLEKSLAEIERVLLSGEKN